MCSTFMTKKVYFQLKCNYIVADNKRSHKKIFSPLRKTSSTGLLLDVFFFLCTPDKSRFRSLESSNHKDHNDRINQSPPGIAKPVVSLRLSFSCRIHPRIFAMFRCCSGQVQLYCGTMSTLRGIKSHRHSFEPPYLGSHGLIQKAKLLRTSKVITSCP